MKLLSSSIKPHACADQLGAIGSPSGYEIVLKASTYMQTKLGFKKLEHLLTTFNRTVFNGIHPSCIMVLLCSPSPGAASALPDLLNGNRRNSAILCPQKDTAARPVQRAVSSTFPRRWRHNTIYLMSMTMIGCCTVKWRMTYHRVGCCTLLRSRCFM